MRTERVSTGVSAVSGPRVILNNRTVAHDGSELVQCTKCHKWQKITNGRYRGVCIRESFMGFQYEEYICAGCHSVTARLEVRRVA